MDDAGTLFELAPPIPEPCALLGCEARAIYRVLEDRSPVCSDCAIQLVDGRAVTWAEISRLEGPPSDADIAAELGEAMSLAGTRESRHHNAVVAALSWVLGLSEVRPVSVAPPD